MPRSEDIISSVADANLKQLAELHVAQTGLMREEGVAHWSRLNKIAEAAVARAVKGLVEMDPSEAMSANHALTQNAYGKSVSDNALVAAIAQIFSKAAGNTPPVTP